ncbi:hypothetical protein BSKO_03379 [Bryopsis sp. KO-2023]|nr:hypothetical protein BSKO_03379 [Bryopsis sp. KO-2023]
MRVAVQLPKFVQLLAHCRVPPALNNSARTVLVARATRHRTAGHFGGMKQSSITRFFGQRAAVTAAGANSKDKEEGSSKESPSAKKNQKATTKNVGMSPRKAVASKKRQAEMVKKGEADAGTPRLKRLRKLTDAKAGEESSKVDSGLEDTPVKSPRPQSPKSKSNGAPSRKSKSKSKSKSPVPSSGSVSSGSVDDPMDLDVVSGEEGDTSKGTRSPRKKKSRSPSGSSKKKKVEGVGNGSVAAASLHNKFDVESIATWKEGENVPYQFLTDAFERISGTTKRLEIARHLTDTFRAIIARSPDDLLPAVYLCVNCVAPAHTGLELGVGDAILIKALGQAVGKSGPAIKKLYEVKGDLGQVAVDSRGTQRTIRATKPLTLKNVFKAFENVAKAHGDKSQERKKDFIMNLLVASKNNESGYIIRSLQGKLRIGLAEQTVLVALGHAIHLEKDRKGSKSELAGGLEAASQSVKKAFSVCPSFDKIIPVLLENGTVKLDDHVGFVPGVPVRPMLAKPTNGISEVLDKFSDVEFTCEYKYDGERAQVHMLEDGTVRIYSRNAEDTTEKYPDIVEIVRGARAEGMTSAVLDAEAVAYDEKEGILPFQVLSTRARKDVAIADIKVKVCVFCFDCLYLNGVTLLEKDLTERRKALYSAIRAEAGKIEFATAETSKDVEELQAFLDKSVEQRTEGLIVKTLDATYEPSRRSVNWLKLKKDYLDGVGDTFDVVPVGAWHGKGKRAGVYGSYLLAVYDPDGEEFQTISKIGTGFSDEILVQLATEMNGHLIDTPKQYYRYSDTLVPEVWFEPKVVWEVKAADLSISPVHQAAKGLVDPAKGISIRFPRLVRVRDDRTPETATSAQQVAEMYQEQPLVKDRKTEG